ncbi:hypothetical protein ACLBXM_23050 [Xanthobacteraceae bacterium A53D]
MTRPFRRPARFRRLALLFPAILGLAVFVGATAPVPAAAVPSAHPGLAAPERTQPASFGTLPAEEAAPLKAPVPRTPDMRPKEQQRPPAATRPAEPAGPIDNWNMFDAHFEACLAPVDGPEDATLTLRFAVDHKGRLKGTPRATYSKLPGSKEDQKAFVTDAMNSLAGCLPLDVTRRFGPIVAQRPLILRFLAPQPKQRGI